LDSTEMVILINIAANSTAISGTQSRSILEYAYGYNYCNCPGLSDTAAYKSQSNNWSDFEKLLGIDITAKPNPAREWTAFNYTLPGKDSKGVIRITDISGKLIQIINVNSKQGQEVWDTRLINAGVYFYTLQGEGLSKTGKIVISK